MVRTPAEARRVAAIVAKLSQPPARSSGSSSRGGGGGGSGGGGVTPAPAPPTHAWDTEVVGLDLDAQSPVGHGRVICASFYSGPEVDYGAGPRVWIDSLAQPETLLAFRGVLEDARVRKVWHNYGFDRHVLRNAGVDCRGFFGDTMHMARLCDTSLKKSGGYSLAALSANRELLDEAGLGAAAAAAQAAAAVVKQPLMELFGKPKRKKNGEDSKVKELPPLDEVQTSPDAEVRRRWVEYSSRDAEVTWRLYQALRRKLSDARPGRFRWQPAPVCFDEIQFEGVNALDPANAGKRDTERDPPSALELYERVIMPFGELLTDLERNGMSIDVARIEQAGLKAAAQREEVIRRFKAWAVDFSGRPDMAHFNVHSDMQKVQLLFGLPRKAAAAGAAPGVATGAAAAAAGPASPKGSSAKARSAAEQADLMHDEDGDDGAGGEIDLLPPPPPPPLQSPPPPPPQVSARKAAGAAGTGKRKRGAEEALPALSSSMLVPPLATAAHAPASAGSAGGHPLERSRIMPPEAEPARAPAPAPAAAASAPKPASAPGRSRWITGPANAPTTAAGSRASAPSKGLAPLEDAPARSGGGAGGAAGGAARSAAGGGHWGGGGAGGGGGGGRSHSRLAAQFFSEPLLPPWLQLVAQRRFLSAAAGGAGSGGVGGGGGSGAGGTAVPVRRTRRVQRIVKEGGCGSGSDLEFVPGGSWLSSDSDSNGSDLEEFGSALSGGSCSGSGWRDEEDEEDENGLQSAAAAALARLWSTPGYLPVAPAGAPLEPLFEFESENTDGFVPPGAKAGAKPKKKRPFLVPSLFLPVMEKTLKGRASGSAGAIKKLVGKPVDQSPAFRKLVADGCAPDVARRACERIGDLLEIAQIDTTIETFIEPLLAAGLEHIDDAIARAIADVEGAEAAEGAVPASQPPAASAPSALAPTALGVEPPPPAANAADSSNAAAAAAAASAAADDSAGVSAAALAALSAAVPLSAAAAHAAAHAAAKAEGSVAGRLALAAALGVVPAARVHCSLNLNTETGRLSARRPNMQNQPSLDRDRFRIRSAFVAPPGRALVVADYGQLELRVLAHLAGCASMVAAFKAGGDFHSRTAIGMYPHVRQAVERGDVLLEWDEERLGRPPKPLLKDAFKEERRKAKVLNFSIAYGKTAYGLAKDWEISHAEAERTVELWYGDRPEVQLWQERTKELARRTRRVYTILGRHRDLPDINTRLLKAHSERAAINTPIQGSAADIVMMAMLKVWRCKELEALGFRMLLQVHDELILEGPAGAAPRALERVVELMGAPFDRPLLVDLVVDAKVVTDWGSAK